MTYQQPQYQDPNAQYAQQYQQPVQYAPMAAGPTWSQQKFVGNHFVLKQKILSLGNQYYLYAADEKTLVGFVHGKIFTIKDDIRIFTDETQSYEMMKIKQENIIDFSGTYQIMDSQSGELIGILQRKGLKSMIKDEWIIMNRNRQEIGLIKERGGFMWFMRRFIFKWLPYKYDLIIAGQPTGEVVQKFKIIGSTFILDVTKDPNLTMDRRLGMACCLMMSIEERRKR